MHQPRSLRIPVDSEFSELKQEDRNSKDLIHLRGTAFAGPDHFMYGNSMRYSPLDPRRAFAALASYRLFTSHPPSPFRFYNLSCSFGLHRFLVTSQTTLLLHLSYFGTTRHTRSNGGL